MLDTFSTSEAEQIRRLLIMVMGYLDSDYQTRIGLEKSVAHRILGQWPELDVMGTHSDFSLLVHNSFNDAIYGAGIKDQECQEKIGCSRNELIELFEKWQRSKT